MTHEAVAAVLNDFEVIARAAKQFMTDAEAAPDPAARGLAVGMAAYEMREYALAFEHLLASERLSPTGETAARLALCCWRSGRLDEAADWINEAVNRDPRGTIKAHCIGTSSAYSTVLAAIELERGNADRALELIGDGSQVSNEDALLFVTQANALLARGAHEDAARAMDRARSIAPPYLLRQIEGFSELVSRARTLTASGQPFLAEFAALSARKAI